ncbi:MAG TPA: GNAT family N-acetyltransferase [Thermoanaerobaculia bacterium]|nr:GNAT family N-acetyltransferase [Thermoanaerobaculia bacterium]
MITIRRATPADAAVLAELGARTFSDTFAKDNTPENMAAFLSKTYGEAQQRRELEDPATFTLLAEEDGVALAFATMHRDGGDSIEIARFYVDRPHHGRGLAQTLMSRVIEEAGNVARIWLVVWEHNPRAIAFYEKCGFRRTGAVKPFIIGNDVQNDCVMERRFDTVREADSAATS